MKFKAALARAPSSKVFAQEPSYRATNMFVTALLFALVRTQSSTFCITEALADGVVTYWANPAGYDWLKIGKDTYGCDYKKEAPVRNRHIGSG